MPPGGFPARVATPRASGQQVQRGGDAGGRAGGGCGRHEAGGWAGEEERGGGGADADGLAVPLYLRFPAPAKQVAAPLPRNGVSGLGFRV